MVDTVEWVASRERGRRRGAGIRGVGVNKAKMRVRHDLVGVDPISALEEQKNNMHVTVWELHT